MGICKYCGKPAGFLRSKHDDCERQHNQRYQETQNDIRCLTTDVVNAIKGITSVDEIEDKIIKIQQSESISESDGRNILITGWEQCVDQYLEDDILSEEEEKRLKEFMNRFSLSQNELDRNGALTKIAKAAVLRDICNGIIPEWMKITGDLPINFQKTEKIVWGFPNSKYLEDRTKHQFVGSSQGVSIRVMKGVYYRTGAFKGTPISYTEQIHVDTGWVVITSKNFYFSGPKKSFRVPYSKIISFQPFNDGIGIMRDASTARPQIFVTGDGWFVYNMVTNLAKM